MNMISKIYFDVAPSLISQAPFAKTSAIVVLTTPSALPDIEPAYTFGCGRLPDRLHTSIVHLLAVGVLLQLKQRVFIRATHTCRYIRFARWSLMC